MKKGAYIVGAKRTPFGSFGGSLAPVRTDDLGAIPIRALIEDYPQIPLDQYDEVILGCANQAGEDNRNVGRMCALLAGLPWNVPGETVNRLCASGMSSIAHAHRAIAADEGDLFISGGVEHMTRGPFVMSKVSKAYGRDTELHDSSFGWRFVNPKMKEMYGVDGMGATAENLAVEYKIGREEQDRFAYHSQKKAAKAQKSGRFAEEIVPVLVPQRRKDPIVFSEDEFIKPKTTLKVLGSLRTAFKKQEEGGTVTAGNASGLNDGAAAALIGSHRAVQRYDLNPLARIVSTAVVGVEPRIMGIGPAPASLKALNRAGLKLKDMDIIELNEAFSAQVLSCLKELKISAKDKRINPNGGAIAIGHPLGVSGTRILHTAALELHKRNGRYALVSMCVGVGQGYAVIIEKV